LPVGPIPSTGCPCGEGDRRLRPVPGYGKWGEASGAQGGPLENLAAFGVAFSLAWLVESPVLMPLSASTAQGHRLPDSCHSVDDPADLEPSMRVVADPDSSARLDAKVGPERLGQPGRGFTPRLPADGSGRRTS
jgi:hypothetical protein